MKELAGAMYSLPELKVKSKDLNTCFSGVTVPPEYLHFVQISFDKVLEYQLKLLWVWQYQLCRVAPPRVWQLVSIVKHKIQSMIVSLLCCGER